MQDYFTHAKHVGDLTRIFLAALEARHVKPRPSLGAQAAHGLRASARTRPARATGSSNGRLDLVDPDAFRKDPVNILRLFEEGLATDIPIHPDALRRVAASLRLIDDRVRADPEANRIFLDLLLGHNNPERALRLMNEVGRARRLHPRVRPHRRDDAVQHVPPLHGGRAHHPHDLDAQPDRARRARRRPAGRHRHHRARASTAGCSTSRCCCTTSARARAATIRRSAPRSPSGSAPRFGLDAEETELVVWLVQQPPADVRHRAEARPRPSRAPSATSPRR